MSAPLCPEPLTVQDTEILRLLAVGQSPVAIAQELGLTETIVNIHVSSVLIRLGVTSRTLAALHAFRTGVASVDDLR